MAISHHYRLFPFCSSRFREPTPLQRAPETTGVKSGSASFYDLVIHWTRDWQLWLRIILPIFLSAAVILSVGNGLTIDFKNWTITRSETESEKNCRSESQAFASFDQGLNSNIGELNDQVSILVRDMNEIRKKCLAEMPAKPGPSSEPASVTARRDAVECSIPPDFSTNFNPSGRYGLVLRELSHQQGDIRSQITALQEQQRQEHQRLIELCSSHH
jgi:hypothetical protein